MEQIRKITKNISKSWKIGEDGDGNLFFYLALPLLVCIHLDAESKYGNENFSFVFFFLYVENFRLLSTLNTRIKEVKTDSPFCALGSSFCCQSATIINHKSSVNPPSLKSSCVSPLPCLSTTQFIKWIYLNISESGSEGKLSLYVTLFLVDIL